MRSWRMGVMPSAPGISVAYSSMRWLSSGFTALRLPLCDSSCASTPHSLKYALMITCCWRASVSRMVLACTSGLPSMSPPTQVPKRIMFGSSSESAVHAVELGERLGELVVERRQDAVEDLGEIEHHVLALVGHRQAFARMIFGLPRGGDLGAHAAPVLAQLLRRQRGIQAVEQQLGDALVLAQHGAAGALGGMRGEHRLDADLLQQLEHLGQREAAVLELGERRLDAARLGAFAGFEEVAAAAADAVHLLGEIDRAEPHGEGARKIARHLRRPAAQLDAEARPRLPCRRRGGG